MTQQGVACGDRTQDLSIRSPTLYHNVIPLPMCTGKVPRMSYQLNKDMAETFLTQTQRNKANKQTKTLALHTKNILFSVILL